MPLARRIENKACMMGEVKRSTSETLSYEVISAVASEPELNAEGVAALPPDWDDGDESIDWSSPDTARRQ